MTEQSCEVEILRATFDANLTRAWIRRAVIAEASVQSMRWAIAALLAVWTFTAIGLIWLAVIRSAAC